MLKHHVAAMKKNFAIILCHFSSILASILNILIKIYTYFSEFSVTQGVCYNILMSFKSRWVIIGDPHI